MALKVSGKNVDIGQALRSRIESTISAAGKYPDGSYSGCRRYPPTPRQVIWSLRKCRWYASAMRTTVGSNSFTVVTTDISAGSDPVLIPVLIDGRHA